MFRNSLSDPGRFSTTGRKGFKRSCTALSAINGNKASVENDVDKSTLSAGAAAAAPGAGT